MNEYTRVEKYIVAVSSKVHSDASFLLRVTYVFPQSRIGSRGTGWYHAVVEELVVQCVRPTRWAVLINGHGRIVRKVCVPEHFEHVVSSDLHHRDMYSRLLSDN